MRAAVLALQGAFLEHEKILESLGVPCFELRKKSDLEKDFDALVLPGGESTVQGKLLRELEMFEPLKQRIESGIKVLATCAGLILLAEKIETIITRGILNTRPRDFYDVYILTKTQGYNAETLRKAIFATAEHRGTKAIMEAETNNRLALIENSSELQSQWAKYQKKFPYAKDITYQETVNAVKEVIHEVYI